MEGHQPKQLMALSACLCAKWWLSCCLYFYLALLLATPHFRCWGRKDADTWWGGLPEATQSEWRLVLEGWLMMALILHKFVNLFPSGRTCLPKIANFTGVSLINCPTCKSTTQFKEWTVVNLPSRAVGLWRSVPSPPAHEWQCSFLTLVILLAWVWTSLNEVQCARFLISFHFPATVWIWNWWCVIVICPLSPL